MMVTDFWPDLRDRDMPKERRCGRAETCEYCGCLNVPGDLCESRMESGELVDVTFVCNACLEEIERDIRNEQLLDCGGSA